VRKAFIEGTFSSHALKNSLILKYVFNDLQNNLTIHQLLETTSHYVNIFNTEEMEFNVFIIYFIFISLSLSLIDHCVDLKE
jgi:hypothetical protein